MVEEDGFWYPQIDNNICIGCKTCQKACPIISPLSENNTHIPKAFAVWIDDLSIRKRSASGGLFYAIAYQMIEKGGYVVGAVFDGINVKHIITNKLSEIHNIQGVKYFQSNTSGIYNEVKRLLGEGEKVLFSGTSCQVAGLLKHLGGMNENLVTVDLICFGVPSALTVGVEERMRGKILKRIISSRDKEHQGGWLDPYYMTCEWEDGSITVSSQRQSFMLGSFCSGKVMRKSCYHCPFKLIVRQSDITIGDYHCIKDFEEQKNDGISLAYVQSDKGAEVLKDNINITIHERELLESLPYKRAIFYNDKIYENSLARRFMIPILHKAPLWFVNIFYRHIVKSKNPLIWPFTVIDVVYFWLNNRMAKNKINKIIKQLQRWE